MRARKPLLIVVLTLALLAAALIVPAAASGANDNGPTAWAKWAQSEQYTEIKVWTGTEWSPLQVPWQAAFSVEVQEGISDAGGLDAEGHELMNWQSAFDLVGTGTPPWKHNWTTQIVDWRFDDLGDGAYRATILFCYDTSALGWPDRYVAEGDVYHVWVLTDNPGDGMDHVDLYTQMATVAPDIEADSTTWGVWVVDLDCRGVQVVMR